MLDMLSSAAPAFVPETRSARPNIKYRLSLTAAERAELAASVAQGRHRSPKVLNALILLNSDASVRKTRSLKEPDVAAVLPVSAMKIHRVKQRFVEEGLAVALHGRPSQRVDERKADGAFEAPLVALSCRKPPPGHIRWSLRLLADQLVELQYVDSISYETVRRVLKKTNSNPGKRMAGSSRRSTMAIS